jgi:hypothetical protein
MSYISAISRCDAEQVVAGGDAMQSRWWRPGGRERPTRSAYSYCFPAGSSIVAGVCVRVYVFPMLAAFTVTSPAAHNSL